MLADLSIRVIAAAAAVVTIVAAAPEAPQAQPSVLIVQHAYDGPVESAGALVRWQYSGGSMLVEWIDTTTDGVFRAGFEVIP
jgi:hypothetical protein